MSPTLFLLVLPPPLAARAWASYRARMSTWLIKSEPSVYPYAQLVAEGRTAWTGVRNFTARNNLAAMKRGDRLLYYHSGEDKAVVGIAEVVGEACPDPTIPEDPRWVAVDVGPVQALPRPVTLAQVKADPLLSKSELVRQSRLSVAPITADEYARFLELGGR